MPAPRSNKPYNKPNPVLQNWDWLYHHPTVAELKLEPEVAKLGIPYRFQHRVWNYILDFALPTLRLAIEVDDKGHTRADKRRKDADRTEWLERHGWRVLRTTNAAVLADAAGALRLLLTAAGVADFVSIPTSP